MEQVKLSPPWFNFRNKVAALFELDPQVQVDELTEDKSGNPHLGILVKSHTKFVAMDRVLPPRVAFGNVTLYIDIFDMENKDESEPGVQVFKDLFEGNRLVRDIREVVDAAGQHHAFVRFEPEVIQFYDDNLTDFNGNWNGLAQDIAKELFYTNWSVQFCTAAKDENLAKKPLGEWP